MVTGRKLSASKNSAQGRRSRLKQPTPRKPRVNFFDSRPLSITRCQQSKNVKGRENGVVKWTQHTVTRTGWINWRRNPFWTCYHGTLNFITFHMSISPTCSHELLTWVSSFDSRFDLQQGVCLFVKYRTSVVASICITSMLISPMIRILTPNCT